MILKCKTAPRSSRSKRFSAALPRQCLAALLLVAFLIFSDLAVFAHPGPQPTSALIQEAQQAPKIPNDQLDSLVAPIALYPDPLLTQTLVASTYPLEIIQLEQWLEKNKNLKDKKLTEAVSKQPWDPSVQAMAALPDVVKRLADDIQWATDLGNAFLAQQSDVMDAVQRMRTKAQGAGALKSSEQLKVKTEVVESKTVIVVEQSNPQVVYVPSYNPTVVYGPPVYPYPPISYPSTGAVIAASAISFGVGVAIGAAWGNGGWGWHAGWGHNDVNINVNNNFNRNTNISGGNRINNIQGGNRVNQGGNKWQHNPQHRGGAPYANRDIANRYGGTARGASAANRQAGARQQIGRQGGNLPSTRDGNRGSLGDRGGAGNRASVSDRAGNARDRSGTGNRAGVSDRAGNARDRSGAGNRASVSDRAGNNRDRGGAGNRAGVSDRAGSIGGGNRSSLGGGGGDRIGNRDVSRGGGGQRGSGSFGGGGFGGGAARASSSRGASSMGGGGRGGGGGARAGGGGGGRGGGGRRR